MAGKVKQLQLSEGVSVATPTEVDMVDTVNAQTIGGIKTFSSEIKLTEIATPATPAAGFVSVYAKSDNKVYKKVPDGTESELGAGGSSGRNYILNPMFEDGNITGWSAYADAAATTPVDGTGGAPSSTVAYSTITPLRQTGSMLFTKGAVNRQGEGISYAFTIDNQDKSRPVTISFDASMSSGYTGSSSTENLVVYIYDVTNATLISPSSINIAPGVSPFQAFFIASTSTSYRLIIHASTTGTVAYTGIFDNFYVGPQNVVNGVAGTDWQQWTPTFTNLGTVSTQSFWWRQNGDSIDVIGTFTTGTVAAGTASFTLPNSVTTDTSKTGGMAYLNGYWGRDNATATTRKRGPMYISPASNLVYFSSDDYTTAVSPIASMLNGSTAFANTEKVSIVLNSVSITTWSSNVQMANRAVEEYASNGTTTNADDTASPTFVYGSAGSQFPNVSASSKTKRVRFQTPIQPTDKIFLEIHVSGVNHWKLLTDWMAICCPYQTQGASTYGMGWARVSGSATDCDVNFGAYRIADHATTFAGAGSLWSDVDADSTYTWRLTKVSGGASVGYPISPVNLVKSMARYTTSAGQSISHNTNTTVDYGTKTFDIKSEVTTGASWKFTAKETGYYRVTVRVMMVATTTWAPNTDALSVSIYKNGVNGAGTLYSSLAFSDQNIAGSNIYAQGGGTDIVYLLAGEYISLVVLQTSGAALAMHADATANVVTIEQVN